MPTCEKCTKRASFNILGLKGRFCAQHKTVGMVDVFNKKCNCGLAQPGYNLEGLKAEYCTSCKTDEMVDLRHKKCKCGLSRACYNIKGLKAEYCYTCKTENMTNVVDKPCHCGLSTSPSYNYNGLRPKFCVQCKLPDMVELKNLKCFCKSARPTFNFDGLFPRYCSKCKLENMIDTRHEKCFCGKSSTSCFNYEGQKPQYCSQCKLDGMINVKSKLCFCGKVQPNFNFEGLSAKYCMTCKKTGMVDVHHKKCKTLYCDIRVQEKYDGYCCRCYVHMFPDKPVSKNYKTKEYSVVEYVKTRFCDFSWVEDKVVQDGCSKKRPDLLLDIGYQVIIVEVDENQHRKYDCSCENKRIMEISKDLGHRPIVFIRFNPDDYYNENNEKVKSCWSITKITGLMKIEKPKEWKQRLECLSEQIQFWTGNENSTDKTIEIVELFYDKNLG